jgi:hypothetical protein
LLTNKVKKEFYKELVDSKNASKNLVATAYHKKIVLANNNFLLP